jgi:hypothetical protein
MASQAYSLNLTMATKVRLIGSGLNAGRRRPLFRACAKPAFRNGRGHEPRLDSSINRKFRIIQVSIVETAKSDTYERLATLL